MGGKRFVVSCFNNLSISREDWTSGPFSNVLFTLFACKYIASTNVYLFMFLKVVKLELNVSQLWLMKCRIRL